MINTIVKEIENMFNILDTWLGFSIDFLNTILPEKEVVEFTESNRERIVREKLWALNLAKPVEGRTYSELQETEYLRNELFEMRSKREERRKG